MAKRAYKRDSHGRFAGSGGGGGRRGAASKRSTTRDSVGRRKVKALKASSRSRAATFGSQIVHGAKSAAGNRRRFGRSNLGTIRMARGFKGGRGASMRATRSGNVRVHYKNG